MDVISESQLAEDSPKFKQGEKVILFLYKKQLFGDKPFGNDYTVVNYLQGKYGVDENGRVSSLVVVSDTFANKMTIADFQKKISQDLAEPISNDTEVQNETNVYSNDTDSVYSNDTNLTVS